MGKRTFSAQYREEAVKMVLETSQPIAAIARDLGINEGTLGNWVNKYRNDHPASEELNISERSRLKELEKENRELRMERDFLKKSRSLLREGTMSEKFDLIAAEKADPASPYRVVKMCTWLQVSTSGFYDHCDAMPSARALRRAKITTYVQAAFDLGRGAYGVRRVHAVLQRSDDPRSPACRRTWSGRSWPNSAWPAASPAATRPPPSQTPTRRPHRRTWSAGTSPRPSRAPGWSGTSPTFDHGPAGCTWPP